MSAARPRKGKPAATRGRKADGARGARVGRAAEGRDRDHRELGVESRWSSLFGGTERREGLDGVVTRRGVSSKLTPTGRLGSASTARRFFPWGRVQAGFSLLEALFVVAVLGILLALAFPTYQRVVMERRVQNLTREIAGLLRAAQQAAVAKSAEAACVAVKFDGTEVQVYAVPLDPQGACTNAAGELLLRAPGLKGGDGEIHVAEPLGVSVTPTGDVLVFAPSGEPSPAPFQVTVSGGGHTRFVCVNAAGLVTVPPAGQPCPTQ